MARAILKRGKSSEEVESQMTSMLDLIFNVLAFFVVTFKPPEPEANFDYILPPPKKQEEQTQTPPDDPFSLPEEEYDTISIRLAADANGDLKSVVCDDRPVRVSYSKGTFLKKDGEKRQKKLRGNFAKEMIDIIKAKVDKTKAETGDVIDTAELNAPQDLHFAYVISVVNALHRAGIHKINFGGQEKGAKAE